MDDRATDSSVAGGSVGFYSLSSGPQLVLRPPTDVTSASTPPDVTSHPYATYDGENASLPSPPPSPPPSPSSPPTSIPQQQLTYGVEPRSQQRRRTEEKSSLPPPPPPPHHPHSRLDESGVNLSLDESYSNLNTSRASYNRPHDTGVDFWTATENPAYEYDPAEYDSVSNQYINDVSEHNVSYSRNLPTGRDEHNVSYSRNLPTGDEHNVSYSRNLPDGRDEHNVSYSRNLPDGTEEHNVSYSRNLPIADEHNMSYSRNLPTGRDEHNVSYSRNLPNGSDSRTAAEFKPNDSLDSIPLGEDDGDYDEKRVDDSVDVSPAAVGRVGIENEAYAYDGDYETDFSFQGGPPFEEGPTLRNKDPLPILERPVSGRYQKNPVLERSKPVVAQGPYIPQAGVYLNPPLAIKTDNPPVNTKVRKRIPRPPSKLRIKCAYFWSCCACLLGSFFCAIPALRYTVSASESRKIGDYNSANSDLRKTAILATVALAMAVGGWTVFIMHLSGSLS